MPLFHCSICGENFPGRILQQEEAIGFYTTRFVVADSADEAELLALSALQSDPKLEVPPESRTKDAKVYFEAIEEVPSDTDQVAGSGFVFFTMGT